jgi:Uma2 family endonuclease
VLGDTGRLETTGVFRGAEVVESAVFPGLRATPDEIFGG